MLSCVSSKDKSLAIFEKANPSCNTYYSSEGISRILKALSNHLDEKIFCPLHHKKACESISYPGSLLISLLVLYNTGKFLNM